MRQRPEPGVIKAAKPKEPLSKPDVKTSVRR
jgi:hypothetical protein